MGDLEPVRRSAQRAPLGPAQVRVGDEERRRIVDELQRHYVLGRLGQQELDERVSRALAARTFGDLDAEIADLPPEPTAAGAEATSSRTSAQDDRTAGTGGHDWHGTHGLPLHGSKDFRAHALSYGLVMALLVAIWLITTPGGYFWPIWPMLGWGFGVAAHGLGGRGRSRTGERD